MCSIFVLYLNIHIIIYLNITQINCTYNINILYCTNINKYRLTGGRLSGMTPINYMKRWLFEICGAVWVLLNTNVIFEVCS